MPNPKDIASDSGAPMIPEQRRELILRQLRKHQVLSVHQLMEMFDCSHMTVRRDIALLEQEGRAYSLLLRQLDHRLALVSRLAVQLARDTHPTGHRIGPAFLF
ncbi:DeoR family transcriptional regulator, partial [Pseudomonas chlororaphis]|uniref:DeoR family transcriptional regulator n=1 Tax=Pseudomonas chlororaphis TaxID=587753 RepID=UPI001FF0C060